LPEDLKEMNAKAPSVGFVGGGRITTILLSALARNPGAAGRVVVSDPDPEARRRIWARFPGMAVGADNMEPARQDVVFLALHPPALRKALPEIAGALAAMAHGAIRLLLESGLPFAEVEDTVPVKPLADDAPAIANAYRTRLTPLYRKLTGKADA
jgi:pyrroline-5-carboxylate reductase